MGLWKTLRYDLRRYRNHGKFEWFEPSLGVIILYRFGHAIQQIRLAPLRWILKVFHVPVYMIVSFVSGIHIARGAQIGAGFRVFHFGCIVINSGVVIGNNCTVRHGVTMGNRLDYFDLPTLGDNVDVGAGAKILGAIRIGNNVSVGANAVVIKDVPDNCIAVGVPARVIPKKKDLVV